MSGFRIARSLLAASIRTRLTVWNAVVLTLVLVALGTALLLITRIGGAATLDQDLMNTAYALRSRQEDMMAHPPPHMASSRPPPGPWPQSRTHLWMTEDGLGPFGEPQPRIIRPDGRPLPPLGMPPGGRGSEGGNIAWDPAAFRIALQGSEKYSTIHVQGQALRVASIPVRQKGRVVGVVQAVRPLAELDRDRQSLLQALLTLLPVALAFTGLTGWALTSRALRPVGQIASAAERVGAESLTERLPVTGQDEFSRLASAFNGMLDRLENAFVRLEQAYQQQKRFTADASHELRSPLAIIKAHTSLMLSEEHTASEYRQSLAVTDRTVDRTSRIVQDLLLLARADSGQYRPTRQPVSLRSLLDQALDSVRLPGNPPAYLRLTGDHVICGNSDALVRLFGNLLSNAARHTPSDGRITVSAETHEETILISVEDTGEGIGPDHLPHLFERFYRADASRTREDGGTGLGLAICRSIAEAHEGSIEIESKLGKGTVVRVRLPRVVGHSTTGFSLSSR